MDMQLLDSKKKKIEISDEIFGCKYNESLVHQVATAFLAAGRAGTQAQKTRSEVSGGGAKPFKQKGSGRARAGTSRSPLWRKGGVIFAAQPRSYDQKVNKKMYKGAVRSILSELLRLDRLFAVDIFEINSVKTKELLNKLKDLKIDNKVLIITEELDEKLYLASRNLPLVDVRDVAGVDPISLLSSDNVIITTKALKQFEELLK